jgi:hypothetical protein
MGGINKEDGLFGPPLSVVFFAALTLKTSTKS